MVSGDVQRQHELVSRGMTEAAHTCLPRDDRGDARLIMIVDLAGDISMDVGGGDLRGGGGDHAERCRYARRWCG